jgi:RimJ/RimL family protein N-acetyltransferase
MPDIRLLTPDDTTQYATIWRKALVEQAEYFRIALADNPAQDIPTRFGNDSFTLGVFSNGSLKGSVSIERDSRIKFRHKALLFKMFVDGELAGKGVGRALMTQAMDLAAQVDGLRQLYLTVLASNRRAIHLYTSLGFVEFAHEPEAVLIGDSYVDEIQMVHFLNGKHSEKILNT